MKRLFALSMAAVVLVAFALPADAQSRGNRTGGNDNHGGMHYGGGDHGHGGHYYYHGGGRVNFYFGGGFGYPFYGYPYWGYPYWGYPYGYVPYGYPVGAYYSYDPRGVYQGEVVSRGGKGLSLAARVQQQLAAAGYYHGAIDGIVGEETRRAIRKYERDNGLPVDGRIDDQLVATLTGG